MFHKCGKELLKVHVKLKLGIVGPLIIVFGLHILPPFLPAVPSLYLEMDPVHGISDVLEDGLVGHVEVSTLDA